MAKQFKVWGQIEAIDPDVEDDEDSIENVGEPVLIGQFDTEEKAAALLAKLTVDGHDAYGKAVT